MYILRTNNIADLPAITSGIGASPATAASAASTRISVPVLVSAMTDAQGNYTLEGNIPVNAQFILVVKVGKFRRAVQTTLPDDRGAARRRPSAAAVARRTSRACRATRTDGLAVNIPKVAVSTGSIDAMECVFQKMGIANSEFTPSVGHGSHPPLPCERRLAGRGGEACSACGTGTGMTDQTLPHDELRRPGSREPHEYAERHLGPQALRVARRCLSNYDMVVFDCEGGGWDSGGTEGTTLRRANPQLREPRRPHLRQPSLASAG